VAEPSALLYKRWTHSFEEDHDSIEVYRPETYAFPRARGRRSLEFRPDGTCVDWAIGRGDAREARPATWRAEGNDRIAIEKPGGQVQTLRIVRLEEDRLEISRESVP
jgi:hypothetical protein